MTYLVATLEVVYDEEYLIKEMLATGEYGINGYPISEESMIHFIKDREFMIDHVEFLQKWDNEVIAYIQDEDGTHLWEYIKQTN